MEGNDLMDFTTQVKLNIYEAIAATTQAPTVSEVALALEASEPDVAEAFQELAAKRLLVLEPGDPTRIRMAPPFSGLETPFQVDVGARSYYANCVWDALGVAATLHRDADIDTTCADCGESMTMQILDGRPIPQEVAVHFAVPAAQWWDDIIYT